MLYIILRELIKKKKRKKQRRTIIDRVKESTIYRRRAAHCCAAKHYNGQCQHTDDFTLHIDQMLNNVLHSLEPDGTLYNREGKGTSTL